MRNDRIINIDFQGWPVYALTLREILCHLGAVEKDGILGFNIDDKKLDIVPDVYDDDGMAYGVNKRYISEAGSYSDDGDYINIFTDIEDNRINEKLS